ncbi:glycoside hydrolase family 35 protein [Zasmidium cellare ATCC 36951]|uniref:Beta-galactosidase n=1 Tax=Zasmidium cellare ATCC 36951 TaxID=1080233 RepID=A0A6A6C226_ZASCE|nr:glycoside hydrolase family 35 protein [Zasmidium cellare ATCC 36951]KAF2159769.1 glycoside hydrolase family 35 protein [Zasmidium cellare ATCC 36951]
MRLLLLALLASAASAIPSPTSPHQPAFTYNNDSFLLHGKPFQIRGGQIDPQRVHPAYWSDRISKAKAMGLNTIFGYVYWNLLEPSPGQWNFEARNNIAEWYRLVQEAGMYAVLRPGSYICGERDWGGLPSWLMEIPGMSIRSDNEPFLDASRNYLVRLGQEIKQQQITEGGPILMAQVENEYGSFADSHSYTSKLADIMREAFDLVLFTNDGGSSAVAAGQIHGVLAEIDGPPEVGFEARAQYVTDPTSLGPLLDGEYYTTWIDSWASNYTYQYTGPGGRQSYQSVYDDIDYILSNNASFSLYMFHGGTNFGFENGAVYPDDYLQPVTSSYDYGSPLDESGRTIELYDGLKTVIQKYVPQGERIPQSPKNLPRMKVPDVQLKPIASLFDGSILGKSTYSQDPKTMEALGQSYGFLLYEHQATEQIQGLVRPGDRPRDRVLIYVNGQRKGVMDSIYSTPNQVTVNLQRGDKLQLLVENMGRTDFGYPQLLDASRGINGSVTIDGKTLQGWNTYKLPLETAPSAQNHGWHGWPGWSQSQFPHPTNSSSVPVFYSGTFRTNCRSNDPTCDTFISIPNGIKGQVWVNGFNLGRYWIVGPQQSLYLPAPVLKRAWGQQSNEIVVLELEPKAGTQMIARGLDERVWGNNPDPDRS